MTANENDKNENDLFREAIKGANPLKISPKKKEYKAPQKKPKPVPLNFLRDERQALIDSISDHYEPLHDIENGEELFYVKQGHSPDLLKKLRKGYWVVQKSIDLHGMISAEAKAYVIQFIAECKKNNVRCVRIVHGKGFNSKNKEPILKNKLKHWLAQKEEVIAKVDEIRNQMPNKLVLKKLPSDTMTMNQIKNQIRKMIADGTKIDLVLLDYIDCVVPESSSKDEWKAEGSVMRGFEAMCHELSLVGWTATQGNRSSISSEVVTTDQMGGSIKKAQVGHVIISVAKTLQQKEMNLATIAITKSRIGKDGVVFENCKFNNELLEIDTESSVTFLGFEEQQEERKRDRVKELLEKRKQREQQG